MKLSVSEFVEKFSFCSDGVFWNHLFLFVVSVALAVLLYYLLRLVVNHVVQPLVQKTKAEWDDTLFKTHFFYRLCQLLPLLMVYHFAGVFFANYQPIYVLLEGLIRLSFVILFLLIIKSFLKFIELRYNEAGNKKRSIKGMMQAITIVLYVITAIIIFSILLGKSTATVLTGLGAASAVIMLIFKDSIVGLVSGIQLTTNDMVQLGDWIENSSMGVDGEVIDITLITVKVQNWDKTIVSVPTYDLVSKSFKNWRGMQNEGIRRIKRSVYIDMNSVKYCTDEMIERFKKIGLLSDYLDKARTEIGESNARRKVDNSLIMNGRQLSNIGVFRMYVLNYLKNNPRVSQSATLMVRHLQPTENGIPIEIYAFSNTSVWGDYETIQSDIFDHVIAAVPYFDLRVYQRSSDKK